MTDCILGFFIIFGFILSCLIAKPFFFSQEMFTNVRRSYIMNVIIPTYAMHTLFCFVRGKWVILQKNRVYNKIKHANRS